MADDKTKLYFVNHGDDDNDLDLMVYATSKQEAVAYWREYFSRSQDEQPNAVGQVPSFEGTKGAIRWDFLVDNGSVNEEESSEPSTATGSAEAGKPAFGL